MDYIFWDIVALLSALYISTNFPQIFDIVNFTTLIFIFKLNRLFVHEAFVLWSISGTIITTLFWRCHPLLTCARILSSVGQYYLMNKPR